jgi:chromatin modification-related protein VID21
MNAEPARGPSPVANAAARAVSLFWTTEDDNLLISLHTAYGSNWKLTADVFNRTTNRPSTDYRLPWDLFDRWDRLAGPNSKTILPDGTEISNPLPEYVAPVDKQARPSHYVNLDRAKKQLRHLSVWEAMRRQQKKRESNPKPGTFFSFLFPVSLYRP